MARHRDIRNMSYDDYDMEDDEYDQAGSYGAGVDSGTSPGSAAFIYQRPGVPAADVAANHHRQQLAARSNNAAAPPPRATANSQAFFKTKPAKKKGKAAPASAAWTANTNADETVGNEDELFGGEDFDAETAAAIEASMKEAKAQQAFLAEAGLSTSSASASAAAPTAARAAPLRSASDQQATLAALEELRLSKQRPAGAAGAGSASVSATSTPKRQLSNEPTPASASASAASAAASPFRIDRPNLPVPTKLGSASATSASAASASSSSLAVPETGSQPSSPPRSLNASPVPSPSSSPLPTSSSSSSSSSSSNQQLPDIAPPQALSAKRTREVNAVLASEADRESAEGNASSSKEKLNMVVIGHVDAGKSTLMGHLLFLQGRVSKKLMHKYEKESKELGKSSFHFAWVLDETEEERSRGITVDVAVNFFETPTKKITLLDAPGHREFIPNMITGAAQADAAILVVPATRGEFEGGFGDDGQIKEHAVLARSLGVSQLILAVNKLDTVGWDQARYNEIVGLMVPYLKSVGYKEKDLQVIPVSGFTGENIMERKEPLLMSWYNGPVLLDLIDAFHLPTRWVDRPVRMCIQDVFRGLTLGQTVAGKLESGTILPRDRLLLLPLGETVSVKAMESRGENINIARAGDNIELGIKDYSDPAVLQVGQWLCDPLHPIPMVVHFRAQIITMNYKVPLLAGSQLVFFTQASTEPVTLHSLHSLVDKTTGALIKKNPRVIPKQSTAIVEITSKNKICLELFRNYRELGRFTLRRGTETVACGIVTRLYRMQ